jgi:Predicted membrane protein (DUF2232)
MTAADVTAFLVGNFFIAGLVVTPAVIVALAGRLGGRMAWAATVALGLAAGVIAAAAPGSPPGLILTAALAAGIGFGGLGIALWHFGNKSIPVGRLFAASVALVFIGTVGQYLVIGLVGGNSLVEIGGRWLAQINFSFDQYITMLAAQVSSDQLGQLYALKTEKMMLVWTLFRLLPTVITFGIVTLVLINLLLARRMLPGVREVRLNRWRVPDPAIWIVLIPGLGLLPYLILQMLGHASVAATTLFYISLNLTLIALAPYIMQGLGVLSFFMRRWQFPRILRGLTYFIILTQGLFAVVPAIGLMEFWTDWRGRSEAQDAAETEERNNSNDS